MTNIYLGITIVVLVIMLARLLASPVRSFEYPYFMSAAFAVFVVPQAFSLIKYPGVATQQALDAVTLMTLLCVLACIIGYQVSPRTNMVRRLRIPLDDQKIFHFGALFILCGFIFGILVGQMSDEARGGSMWTGRATIYQFFAMLAYPGFSICLRDALRTGSAGAWFWTAVGSVIPVLTIVLYGRREPAILFAVTVALTMYFQKRFVVPRPAVAAALLGIAIVIPATSEYRSAVRLGGVQRVTQIDFIGNFQRFLSGAAILELRNAAMVIDTTAKLGNYEWGTGYWDQLVFRFVPAQLLGKEFKESLMFHSLDVRLRQEFVSSGYKVPVGSTITGMADSFRQFGYGGALFFALLAVVFKSLWSASLQRDAVFAQLLYIQTSTSAMRAITHQTVDYLPGLAYNLVFLGLAALYARSYAPQPSIRRARAAVR